LKGKHEESTNQEIMRRAGKKSKVDRRRKEQNEEKNGATDGNKKLREM